MSTVWQNNFPQYIEPQVGLLCGKHAINHILQEEKITFQSVSPNSIYSGLYVNKLTGTLAPDDSIAKTDNNIQLNLYALCDRFLLKAANETQMSVANFKRTVDPRELCDSNHQNIPFSLISNIFQILGYDRESDRPNKAGFWDVFEAKLSRPNTLGVVLNLGAGHYTAISKFLKSCKDNYAYIDSIPAGSPLVRCKNLAEMVTYVKRLPVEAVIYVFDKDDAYPSVAVRRMRSHHGGRRRTRRHFGGRRLTRRRR